MGANVNSDVLDAAHIELRDNGNLQLVNTAEFTDRGAAVADALAQVAMTPGDYTIAAGDAGGDSRKVTMAQKSGINVDSTGTATHVTIVDATRVLRTTTCTSQGLTASNTVTIPAWKAEIAGPVAS